jgi:hypothetical protein
MSTFTTLTRFKPNLSFDNPDECISQSFVFSDHAARHKPLALGRFVCSEPDKHAPIWITKYQIDRV